MLFKICGFQSVMIKSYQSFVFINVHVCSVAISWFDCHPILLDICGFTLSLNKLGISTYEVHLSLCYSGPPIQHQLIC